jgi:hypothetical protein
VNEQEVIFSLFDEVDWNNNTPPFTLDSEQHEVKEESLRDKSTVVVDR